MLRIPAPTATLHRVAAAMAALSFCSAARAAGAAAAAAGAAAAPCPSWACAAALVMHAGRLPRHGSSLGHRCAAGREPAQLPVAGGRPDRLPAANQLQHRIEADRERRLQTGRPGCLHRLLAGAWAALLHGDSAAAACGGAASDQIGADGPAHMPAAPAGAPAAHSADSRLACASDAPLRPSRWLLRWATPQRTYSSGAVRQPDAASWTGWFRQHAAAAATSSDGSASADPSAGLGCSLGR